MRTTNKLLLFLGFFLMSSLLPNLYAQRTSDKPNVIFILTDDQGSVDAGIYGTKDIQTPNIDRLARRGVRFTQFNAAAPICSPSRAAILTGKTPLRAGVPGNAGAGPASKSGLPTAEFTLAEMLQSAGYQTAAIGKWHLGYAPEMQPNAQGFDYFFGHLVGCIDNFSHFYYWNGPNRHDLFQDGHEIYRDGKYFPAMCYDEAAQFMEEHQEKPFFLYYAMNTPHYPYQGSPEWLAYYAEQQVPYPRNLYNAFVSTMDEYIGKLLDKVSELGLDDNTIIIFQSDHGHSTEERAHFGGGSAGPYRGAKGSLFEGGLRVPAIISWPGQLPENEVREQWVVASDWWPTIADLCQITPPNVSIDGKVITDIIRSADAPEVHQDWHWTFGKRWAVRQGDWKLLLDPLDTSKERNPPPNSAADQFFLVNLATDPGERQNLAEQYPERVAALQELHQQWLKK